MENDGRPSEKVLTSFSGASKKGEEVTVTMNTTTAKRKKQKLGKSNSGTATGTNEGQGGPTSEAEAFRGMIYLDGGGGQSNSTGASGVSIGDDLLTKTPSSSSVGDDRDAATAQVWKFVWELFPICLFIWTAISIFSVCSGHVELCEIPCRRIWYVEQQEDADAGSDTRDNTWSSCGGNYAAVHNEIDNRKPSRYVPVLCSLVYIAPLFYYCFTSLLLVNRAMKLMV